MLRIYGHSDDVVIVQDDADLVGNEFSCYSEACALLVGEQEGDGLFVTMTYESEECCVGPGAYWRAQISRIDCGDDNGTPLPWPVTIRNPRDRETPYSVVVEIDCPGGTPVHRFQT